MSVSVQISSRFCIKRIIVNTNHCGSVSHQRGNLPIVANEVRGAGRFSHSGSNALQPVGDWFPQQRRDRLSDSTILVWGGHTNSGHDVSLTVPELS